MCTNLFIAQPASAPRNQSFAAAKSAAYKNPPIDAGTGPFTVTPAYKTAAESNLLARARVERGH